MRNNRNRRKIGVDGKNIVEIGKKTQFTSTNQPKNSGRKPKLYTIAKKAYNASREE